MSREDVNRDDVIYVTVTFNKRDSVPPGPILHVRPQTMMTLQRACRTMMDALDWIIRCGGRYEAAIVESHIEPIWASVSDGQVDEFVRFDVSVSLLLPPEEA